MTGQTIPVRRRVAWGAMAFGVGLAAVIGIRLDEGALAVIAGVACGVAASVPTGLVVLYAFRRRDEANEKRAARGYGRGLARSTPIVVVAPPAAQQLPHFSNWPGALPAPAQAKREFAVIGEEGADDQLEYW
jgi:Na+(H+)/acetate symporter ActP